MGYPKPCHYLPEEWGLKARCPIWGTAPMVIWHESGEPDQIRCQICGLRFEVEQGSSLIRVRVLPQGRAYSQVSDKLKIGKWVEMREVVERIRQLETHRQEKPDGAEHTDERSIPPAMAELEEPAEDATSSVKDQMPDPLYDYKVMADELYELGNTREQVESILKSSMGLTPEQIIVIMGEIIELEKQKHSRQNRNLIIVLTLATLAIIAVMVIAWLAFAGPDKSSDFTLPDEEEILEPTRVSIRDKASLPVSLQALIPPGFEIINAPTPAVKLESPTGSRHTQYPSTKMDAAQLFGGPADGWLFNQTLRGWVLITNSACTGEYGGRLSDHRLGNGDEVSDRACHDRKSVYGSDKLRIIRLSC